MTNAQRFTTEYVDVEDRLRISHQLTSDAIEVTWLTQRLTDRLVRHLSGWLESETQQTAQSEHQQSFAQTAAATHLAQTSATQKTPAVQPPTESKHWLVLAVDVNVNKAGAGEGVHLQFRGQDPQDKLQLSLNKLQLRQWLNIIRSQYKVAQWPLSAWPSWLEEDPTIGPNVTDNSLLH